MNSLRKIVFSNMNNRLAQANVIKVASTNIISQSFRSSSRQMGMEDFFDSKTDPVVTHGRSWTVPDLRRKVY